MKMASLLVNVKRQLKPHSLPHILFPHWSSLVCHGCHSLSHFLTGRLLMDLLAATLGGRGAESPVPTENAPGVPNPGAVVAPETMATVWYQCPCTSFMWQSTKFKKQFFPDRHSCTAQLR